MLGDPSYASFCDINASVSCTQVYQSRYGQRARRACGACGRRHLVRRGSASDVRRGAGAPGSGAERRRLPAAVVHRRPRRRRCTWPTPRSSCSGRSVCCASWSTWRSSASSSSPAARRRRRPDDFRPLRWVTCALAWRGRAGRAGAAGGLRGRLVRFRRLVHVGRGPRRRPRWPAEAVRLRLPPPVTGDLRSEFERYCGGRAARGAGAARGRPLPRTPRSSWSSSTTTSVRHAPMPIAPTLRSSPSTHRRTPAGCGR